MNEHRPNILHQLLHTSAPQSFVVWCRLCHKILFFVASISVEKDKKNVRHLLYNTEAIITAFLFERHRGNPSVQMDRTIKGYFKKTKNRSA